MLAIIKKVALLAAAAAALWLAVPLPVMADGTGVNAQTPPVLSPAEASRHADNEAAYQQWLAGRSARQRGRYVEVPYYYLVTPSHRQATTYYCGPATCQIIDDFWHAPQTQAVYAAFTAIINGVTYTLCPDSNGTLYWLMDNCLRRYTGKSSYDYYGGVATDLTFYDRVEYGLFVKHFPESALVRIDPAAHSDWAPYRYYHAGHIVCIEGFDWRVQADGHRIVRLNDPYNEADYHGGGGNTYGHHDYHRAAVWNGVHDEPSHAMIY